MIEKIKDFAGKAYRWFWDYALCRKDPFTHQLTRMMIRHGVIFWGLFLVICVWLSHYVLTGLIWQRVLSVLGLFCMAWLIDHLADTARNDPKYSDKEMNK